MLGLLPDEGPARQRGVRADASAIVHPGAHIGAGTVIGPHAVIGEHVRIGRNCRIGASTRHRRQHRDRRRERDLPVRVGRVDSAGSEVQGGADAPGHRPPERDPRVRDHPPRHRGRRRPHRSRRRQRLHGLRPRRPRLPRAEPHHLRQRRDARRSRDGRGLRDDQRLFRRPPVLPRRQARLHRRLLGRHQGRAAVREDGRQPCADLRPEHHRPGAPRVSRRTRSPSCAAPSATCCTRTRAARSRRSSAILRSGPTKSRYLVDFIRTSSRGVGLRRPSRRLEEVVEE